MKIKILLIVLGIVIGCVAVLVLIVDHKDTLINQMPGDITVYLHAKNSDWQNLNRHRPEAIIYLVAETGLETDQVNHLFDNSNMETAIIQREDKNWYFVQEKSASIESWLKINNIPYYLNNETVIFPLKQSGLGQISASLKDKLVIKPRLFDFSDIKIYISGQSVDIIPSAIMNPENTEPFWGYLNFKKEKIRIVTTLQAPKLNKNTPLPRYFQANMSLDNINPATYLTQNVSYVPENLDYLLLKNINESMKYQKFDNADNNLSIILIPEPQKSIDELQTVISQLMAKIYPSKKRITLPDNSNAVHLIADPGKFEFELIENTYQLEIEDTSIYIQEIPHENGQNEIIITLGKPINYFFSLSGVFKSMPDGCDRLDHDFAWFDLKRDTNMYLSSTIFNNLSVCVD
ncbi:hypothetical protein COT97_01230 [Candidatus Falkowbacteria bacterium CG10_big_fil_rev_8_21_14_0_10_39_11]|uniref:Uncharacterized protein n=1 Tax=Candidatus Falkowbacteria bacterium CG10_big_fil_rev_8_21_14_0_10_39_11 TaxID=1974565 RepID=A0A2H0V7Y8_9BACT|nr:MAG: hypothetical protein COT97_01230 [Candidatus Falkowbacteria bacterium CG10_big_fil_rev_8_21_14_0_10_39_11]